MQKYIKIGSISFGWYIASDGKLLIPVNITDWKRKKLKIKKRKKEKKKNTTEKKIRFLNEQYSRLKMNDEYGSKENS